MSKHMLHLPTILIALSVGPIALAETAFVSSSEQFRIEGSAPTTTEISALVFYIPLFNFDKKLSEKDCEFTEDRWKPNGPDRNVTIRSERQADGSYTLKIPAEAQRGKCPYVIDSMYLNFENKNDTTQVSQALNLVTARNLKKQREIMSDIGEPMPVADLSELKAVYCEFVSDFEIGLCDAADGSIAISYGIANKGVNYRVDIKDSRDKPDRQY